MIYHLIMGHGSFKIIRDRDVAISDPARFVHSGQNSTLFDEVVSRTTPQVFVAVEERIPRLPQGGPEVASLWSSNVLDGISSHTKHTRLRSYLPAFDGRAL
jgi:hypothetical protein